jgi:hypothetical protein
VGKEKSDENTSTGETRALGRGRRRNRVVGGPCVRLAWTSTGTTLEIATAQADKAVVAALGPICAEKFNAQTDAAAKRVALNDTRSWKRREVFAKEWVTLPGGPSPNSDLIDVCSDLVLKPQTALKW